MTDWILAPQSPIALDADLGIPSFLAVLLAQAGFRDSESVRAHLDPRHYIPASGTALPRFGAVYARLQLAIKAQQKILIVSHSDLDGICSALMLAETFTRWHVPYAVEIPTVYQLSELVFNKWMAAHQPDLIIICDLNTSVRPPIDTLILDHHINSSSQPLLLNPTHLPSQHALYHFSAVGIVFLLLAECYSDRGESRFLSNLQDLLILGLLADSVPLVKDVRYWVQMSLARLRKTKRLGLLSLFDLLGLDAAHLSYDDLTYELIPALASLGRLGEGASMFTLLNTSSRRDQIAILANQTLAFHEKRKFLSRQVAKTVHEQLQSDSALRAWSIFIFENANWERAVLGQVANQIAQIYQRPVILLAQDLQGLARGSARAFGETDLLALFAQCGDLLASYGGHAQAAALSLPVDQIPALQRRLSHLLPNTSHSIMVSAEVSLSQANLELAQMIEQLAPFGNGNPRPLLLTRHLKKVSSAKLGRDDQHRRITVRDSDGLQASFFWWNSAYFPQPEGFIDLVYDIRHRFSETGYETQLTLVDWQGVEDAGDASSSALEWIDCRKSLDLAQIRQQESDLMVWAEGLSERESPGVGFSKLGPCRALLIYTAPASPQLLIKALEKTGSSRVYVHFALNAYDQPPQFLSALLALLRAAQNQFGGKLKLTQLSERMGHSPETIRLALEADYLSLDWESGQTFKIQSITPPPAGGTNPLLARALEEAAAYRRYLQKVSLENLLT